MDFLAKQAFKSATGGAFSKHKDRKKMSEDERKVAELTANKVDMKQRKKDRKAMESDARAELEAATRQAEAKRALEDKANAEKMASLEERRRSTVVKHHEKSEDLFSAAKGVFKKKPEHDLTGATELLKIKDLDKQAVVPYSDAQSRLTHTRVPEKPKVVTSAGKKSSKPSAAAAESSNAEGSFGARTWDAIRSAPTAASNFMQTISDKYLS